MKKIHVNSKNLDDIFKFYPIKKFSIKKVKDDVYLLEASAHEKKLNWEFIKREGHIEFWRDQIQFTIWD